MSVVSSQTDRAQEGEELRELVERALDVAQNQRKAAYAFDDDYVRCSEDTCRCKDGSAEGLTLEQARYICTKKLSRDSKEGAPEIKQKNSDDLGTQLNNRESARQFIETADSQNTEREIQYQSKRQQLPPRAVITYWVSCSANHDVCAKRCGPGDPCWESCPATLDECAQRCGQGARCWEFCAAPDNICEASCGERPFGARSGLELVRIRAGRKGALPIETVRSGDTP